jgi:hypothetical protein
VPCATLQPTTPMRALTLPIAALLLLLSAGCACRCGAKSDVDRTSPVYASAITHAQRPLCVIGDTQRTSAAERLFGREDNDAERRILLDALGKETLSALVLVGDMTSDGSSDEAWRYFDGLFAPLRAEAIPLLPALGNHDYQGSEAASRRHLTERFPWLGGSTWYTRQIGRLGLVWLDSNRADVGARWDEQGAWLERTLDELDAKSDVLGVLVFCHHPAYTRGGFVDDDPNVREAFLPKILTSTKTLALVSGHAHGYEHYVRAGKHFVVTAGGGGPRPDNLKAKSWPGVTDAFPGTTKRPLNYLLLAQDDGGIHVRVRGVDGAAVRDIDRFDAPFAVRH